MHWSSAAATERTLFLETVFAFSLIAGNTWCDWNFQLEVWFDGMTTTFWPTMYLRKCAPYTAHSIQADLADWVKWEQRKDSKTNFISLLNCLMYWSQQNLHGVQQDGRSKNNFVLQYCETCNHQPGLYLGNWFKKMPHCRKLQENKADAFTALKKRVSFHCLALLFDVCDCVWRCIYRSLCYV